MDCNRNAGGREELPPLEGPQTASDFEGRVAAPSANIARRQAHCQQESGSIGFNQWRLLHQFQQAKGLSALERQSEVEGYHIISHSHGGNVVINALGYFDAKKLRTVTFLGCPFIETTSRAIYLLFRSIIVFLMITIISFYFAKNQTSVNFVNLLLLGGFIWFCLSLGRIFSIFDRRIYRQRLRQNLQSESNLRC